MYIGSIINKNKGKQGKICFSVIRFALLIEQCSHPLTLESLLPRKNSFTLQVKLQIKIACFCLTFVLTGVGKLRV